MYTLFLIIYIFFFLSKCLNRYGSLGTQNAGKSVNVL
jgi:hypothetical protein